MFKNRIVLWIALGSLFLNIGVISAAGYVIWRANAAPEPWEMLEEDTGWNDADWERLDALLEERYVRIDALSETIDKEADVLLETLWAEDLDPEAALESFNGVEDQRTDLSRELFLEFVEYLDSLPFEKRSALLDFLLEEDEFALWFY